MSPPLKRGMTAAAFQSLGFSDNMKERLSRLVIGVATIAADNFRKRGSRSSNQGLIQLSFPQGDQGFPGQHGTQEERGVVEPGPKVSGWQRSPMQHTIHS